MAIARTRKSASPRPSVQYQPPVALTRWEAAYGMDMNVSGRVTYKAGGPPSDAVLVQQRQAGRRRADGMLPQEQRVLRADKLGSNGALITLRRAGSGHRTVYVSPQGGLHECWLDRLSGTRAAVVAHEQVLRWLQPLKQQHVAYPLAMVRAICDERIS